MKMRVLTRGRLVMAAVLLLAAVTTDAGDPSVPVFGSVQGEVTFPSSDACLDVGAPLQTVINAVGGVSPLGRTALASSHSSDNQSDKAVRGVATFTAANGDELWATYTAVSVPSTGQTHVNKGVFKIWGGSGRFEGASGLLQATISVTAEPILEQRWPVNLVFRGTLTLPHWFGETGWTKYEGNPVLPKGSPGQWDAGAAGPPVVAFDGTTYRMWYGGGSGSLTQNIGLATSPDGVTWTKHPGNPVLLRGAPGTWDGFEMWPMAAVFDGTLYHLWYSAFAGPTQQVERTGYATSPDGVTWTKYEGNPILPAGPPGSWDDLGATMGGVLLENGVYRLWYCGARQGGPLKAGYATSRDGVTWDKWPEPVLEPSASGWDLRINPGPVVFDGIAYHMWYTGFGGSGPQIGHAVSLDGIHWTKQPADEPVLGPGAAGAFDSLGAVFPAVLLVGDTAQMWYAGTVAWGMFSQVGYATASLPFPDPPVAGFIYDPAAPAVGETVTFTDTTTGGPSSWAWDFGDGATASEENPTHAFAAEGTYTVTLTASNDLGSSTASHDVVVGGGPPALGELYFVAAAANSPGTGSLWVTDVEVNNPTTATITYRFLWLPRDSSDNSAPAASAVFTLAPAASARYENVVGQVFGRSALGALAVAADSADAIVMSRTYNLSATGTFGQSIVGLHSSRLIPADRRMRIVFTSETSSGATSSGYRTNLGFQNGTGSAIVVSYTLYDRAGVNLGVGTVELGPWCNTQLNRVLQTHAPVDGYVDVWTETAGGAFVAYGSVVDNTTGDPTTVMPAELGSGSLQGELNQITYLAAAGNAGGIGSQWATDVEINNPNASLIRYQLMWLPRSTDNSNPIRSGVFTLAPGASARLENVVGELFGVSGFGALAVAADSADAIVMSRTYNVSAQGTFGQSIDGVPASRWTRANERKRIVFMIETSSGAPSSGYRANLGFQNGTSAALVVRYALCSSTGVLLDSGTVDLPPRGNTQLNRVFQSLAPIIGYVDVWTETPGGAFVAYGSVVDNGTGDPTTISPQ